MLYIIALLLFFILLAIVWGKEGVKLGLLFLFFILCCSILAVVLWIYWDHPHFNFILIGIGGIAIIIDWDWLLWDRLK